MNPSDVDDDDFDFDAAQEQIDDDLFGGSGEDESSSEPEFQPTPVPQPAAQEASEPADETPTFDVSGAPKTWRKEAAAAWSTLPPIVQQEIAKREADIFRGIEGYKQQASVGQTFGQLIEPYVPTFQQYGVNPFQHVSELLQAHHILALGTNQQKVELLRHFVKQFKVDLDAAEEAPYVDPQVQALQSQVNQLQSFHSQQQQLVFQQREAAVNEHVDAFANDPSHPYFDDVSEVMTQLITSGVADNLQEAYDKAVYLVPEVRDKELARQAAEKQEAAKQRVAAAKKATGANVRSTPKAVSSTAPLGSIEDTIADTLANIRSRG